MQAVLAHIGGLPVEENLIYIAPVALIVAFIYLQSWRERRHPERYSQRADDERDWDDEDDAFDSVDEPSPVPQRGALRHR